MNLPPDLQRKLAPLNEDIWLVLMAVARHVAVLYHRALAYKGTGYIYISYEESVISAAA